MKRRFFLQGLLLAPVAPAIVRAESLMKVVAYKNTDWIYFPDRTARYRVIGKRLEIETAYMYLNNTSPFTRVGEFTFKEPIRRIIP